MRRAAKIDANHAAIVGALKACGCMVVSLAAVGQGVPDLLCLHRGRLFLVEIKDGSKPPSHRRLTGQQAIFHRDWPVTLISSVEGAIAALNK